MKKKLPRPAKGKAPSPREDATPHDLDQLRRVDWAELSPEKHRQAAEVLHALAYGLVSEDPRILARLSTDAVALMRKHREPVGVTPIAAGWVRGPIVVSGGPVERTHKQTEEVDAMVGALRARLSARWAALPEKECARHVAMYLVRAGVPSAPSLFPHVPGREHGKPHAHLLAREPAAIKAVGRVLLDHRDWRTDVAIRTMVSAVLGALQIPRPIRKQALDSPKKRERR